MHTALPITICIDMLYYEYKAILYSSKSIFEVLYKYARYV